MPYSSELGMRVYDPREGAQEGEAAGQMFVRGFEGAQDRAMRGRSLLLDERRLKMMEDEHQRKASALMLQSAGMDELREMVDNGVPFKDAFFKVSPKLFVDRPDQLGQLIHQEATEQATKAYRDALLNKQRAVAEAQMAHWKAMEGKTSQSPELRRATEEADLILRTRQQTPTEADPAMEAPAPRVSPEERDKLILETLRQQKKSTVAKPPLLEQTAEYYAKLKRQQGQLDTLVESNPQHPELRQMKRDVDAELKIVEQSPSFRDRSVMPEATEKQAQAMLRARNRLNDAYESGDPEEIDNAEFFMTELRRAQKAQHRDPVEQEQLAILAGRIRAIDRILANPTKRMIYPELPAERAALQKQLDNWNVAPVKLPAAAPKQEGVNLFDESKAIRREGAANPPGLLTPGNIDLQSRPGLKPISMEMEGKEVLIPTVNETGKAMEEDEAIANYLRTGKHLGIFRDEKSATEYAKRLEAGQPKTPKVKRRKYVDGQWVDE